MSDRLRAWLTSRFPRLHLPVAPRAPVQGLWLTDVYRESPSKSFMVLGRRELDYHLYVPPALRAGERIPLLLMLHGCTQTAEDFAAGTEMNAVAESRRCAVLYPEQPRASNSMRCWNWFEPETLTGKGEASLLLDVVEQVMGRHPIDPARVYVAGLSAGGAMAAVLSATHANRFAACAIHSGIMFAAAVGSMQAFQVMQSGAPDAVNRTMHDTMGRVIPARLVPTLVLHGTADVTVNPVNADLILEQIRSAALRLYPQSAQPNLGSAQWFEAGGRRCRRQDLTQGGELLVRTFLIEGLGHAWSGGNALHKFFDPAGPKASKLIMDFVMQQRLPAGLEAEASVPHPRSAPL